MSALLDRLRSALHDAMRARDTPALTAIRTALAAVDNAAAVVPVELDPTSPGGPIAGAAAGVGATEVARRPLAEHEIVTIVRAQIDERRAQAETFDRLDRTDAARSLRREADALAALIQA